MQSPKKNKKKSRSGNPAKRAAEEKAWAEQQAQKKGAAFGGGAFGGTGQGADAASDLSNLDMNQLPPELRKMLGK